MQVSGQPRPIVFIENFDVTKQIFFVVKLMFINKSLTLCLAIFVLHIIPRSINLFSTTNFYIANTNLLLFLVQAFQRIFTASDAFLSCFSTTKN